MKTLLLTLISFITSIVVGQKMSDNVYYQSAKSTLSTENSIRLDKWLDKIDIKSLESVSIEGYTDTIGGLAYNVALSENRVSNVKKYLLSKGIPDDIINVSFYGESRSTLTSKPVQDRRVEINLTTKKLIDTSVKDFYSISTLTPQEFSINPLRDTTIVCEKGTIIQIKAGSFIVDQNKSSDSQKVNFQVKEAFLKSEMILENLSTTSDGRILETLGMVYTNAMVGRDTVKLQKEMTIMIPTDKVVDGAKIFEGQRDAHSDIMNWVAENETVLRTFNVKQLTNCFTYNTCRTICQYCSLPLSDTLNQQAIYDCWYRLLCGTLQGECMRCKFFLCRIKRTFKPEQGMFSKRIRDNNRSFRKCQRMLRNIRKMHRKVKRRSKKGLPPLGDSFIAEILKFTSDISKKDPAQRTEDEKKIYELTQLLEKSDDLLKTGAINRNTATCAEQDSLRKLGITTNEELLKAINKPLMDELGVTTMDGLINTISKANLGKLEIAYKNKKISYEDYKFYVFNSSKLGWKNVDVFVNIPESDRVTLKVNIIPEKTIDCKLVFKARDFVLPGKIEAKYFYFDRIPKGEEAWIVAIKFENKIPYLGMKLVTVASKSFDVEFKKLTLEELKEQLKVLD